ncbi:MAG: pectate lyase precursor [Proteobacteria bacterium]|nr:pectate lyase precursor [Pseudomonadota bacterium]
MKIPKTLMLIVLLLSTHGVWAQLKAFPEAAGFAAFVTGGRGGDVHIVTNLNDSGVGSLQWAVSQPGPRIVVFEVSGMVTGDLHIPHGDLTIAGQTAPGAGITLAGHLYTTYNSDTGNIIIRHMRIRPPDPDSNWPASQHDAIQFSTANNIMLDHIDASHGADETIDFWGGAAHITIQHSHLSFPIYDTANGWTHNKGVINHRPCLDSGNCQPGDRTGGYISIINNLFTHARNRTPALSVGPAEVINNITYNGREGFVHHNVADGEFNIMGNHYIAGPSISLSPFWFDPENPSPPIPTAYWLQDNLVEDPGEYIGTVQNPWDDVAFGNAYTFACCGINANQFNQTGVFDFSGEPGYATPVMTSSDDLLNQLLPGIGAYPHDIVARQSIQELHQRSGSWRNYRPADLMAGLTPGVSPLDSDDDGMPDTWEDDHGLNPQNGNDHSTILPSGYTAIEEYINGLASQLTDDVIFVDGFE